MPYVNLSKDEKKMIRDSMNPAQPYTEKQCKRIATAQRISVPEMGPYDDRVRDILSEMSKQFDKNMNS